MITRGPIAVAGHLTRFCYTYAVDQYVNAALNHGSVVCAAFLDYRWHLTLGGPVTRKVDLPFLVPPVQIISKYLDSLFQFC